MKISQLKKLKILILGLGKEGLSTYKFLRQNFPNKIISLNDQKPLSSCSKKLQMIIKNDKKVEYSLGKKYLDTIENFDVIVKSPGINPRIPKIQTFVDQGKILTSATNIFFANSFGKKIGVTGTKGKSTTVSLIYSIFKSAEKKVYLVGNIGTPALSALQFDSKDTLYIYELSSYQLEDIKYSPDIAVFINFFPDHMNYHGDIQSYFEAKTNIFKYMKKDSTLLYNPDIKNLTQFTSTVKCKTQTLKKTGLTIKNNEIQLNNKSIINLIDVPLLGKHNAQNILYAIAVAKYLKINDHVIVKALQTFHTLAHRLEFFGNFKSIDFYSDTISTTPESTIEGILSMPKRIGTLIVGGQDRGYNYKKLAKTILLKKIPSLILFPDTGIIIWEHILKLQKEHAEFIVPKKFQVKNIKECVRLCYKHTPKDTICLLSPAAPSYSQFKSYIQKGNKFKKYVKEMKKSKTCHAELVSASLSEINNYHLKG